MLRALKLIYPSQCVGCGDLVESDHGLCGPCWRDTPFITDGICDACGVPLLGGEPGELALCDDCLTHKRPWSRGRSTLVYEGRARAMVLGLKRGSREDLVAPAGPWMAHAGRDLIEDDTLIVPVPLHWTRLISRRFNQAALLAGSVARATGREADMTALTRIMRTPQLKDATHDMRFKVLKDAIRPNAARHKMRDRAVLLIDDVMTSGATLSAATHAAYQGGARRVDVLTLARAARDA
ncbi:MAG: ComF family protein [Pseudomonadota bacterium]